MFEIIANLLRKFFELLQYPISWVAGLGLFIADVFSGHKFLIDMVVLVTLMDAVWGIAVSLKRKEFTKSELLRLTLAKLAVYGCALFAFLSLDKFVHNETGLELAVTSGLIGVVIVLTELWSSAASMLILFPNFPFLRLMQRALTGELARKLGCDENEVAKVLTAARAKKPMRDDKGRFTKVGGKKKQ